MDGDSWDGGDGLVAGVIYFVEKMERCCKNSRSVYVCETTPIFFFCTDLLLLSQYYYLLLVYIYVEKMAVFMLLLLVRNNLNLSVFADQLVSFKKEVCPILLLLEGGGGVLWSFEVV
jgi:hypothetical protein